jgi:release factor glutamine methyltransferase
MLRDAGISDPRDEALQLWSVLHDTTAGATWLGRAAAISEAAAQRFLTAAGARSRGVPAAYVTGRAAFRHVTLAVDARVLIPRPETEGLVDRVLAEADTRPECHVLEIGVGSGAIIISLAVEGAFARLVGTDICPGALHLARANAHVVAPQTVIEWREGDLWTPVAGEQFDLIVSNPPYIARDEYQLLDPSVRCHEPRIALVSGDDGMTHIAAICAGAVPHLADGGTLVLEIDARRGDQAAALARDAGLRDVRIEPDLFGRDRYLLARNG